MHFYMQQVKAPRGVPGSHCPSHCSTHRDQKGLGDSGLTRVVEKQGGGGPYVNLQLKARNAGPVPSVSAPTPASA